MTELQRLTAFSKDPSGGNPAGVWIGTKLPAEQTMLKIAAEVGYSETVFAAPAGAQEYLVRYYSPEAEVSFCGHATIALGARLGTDIGPGRYLLQTKPGPVPVTVRHEAGVAQVSLVSVDPTSVQATEALVSQTLTLLGWTLTDLDQSLAPAIAAAGARHLLLPVASRERLAAVDYEFDALRDLMLANDLTTIDLFWRESPMIIHSRNLFPVGGVVEDPATGAAAAALGGHLRAADLLNAPASFEIHQGVDMGRPSLLNVTVPTSGGIEVSGVAVPLDGED